MRNVDHALEWLHGESKNPTQSWDNLCQSMARKSYSMPAYGSSAKVAWSNVASKYKTKITSPNDKDWWRNVPAGAILYSTAGSSGHAWVCADRGESAYSNDYARKGKIDKVEIDIPKWSSYKAACVGYVIGTQWYSDNDGFFKGLTEDLWDHYVPPVENIVNGMVDQTKANSAVWRLTCRLHDIGFGKSTPIRYEQTFPNKNYGLWCDANGADPATYTDAVHIDIFG